MLSVATSEVALPKMESQGRLFCFLYSFIASMAGLNPQLAAIFSYFIASSLSSGKKPRPWL